MKQTLALAAGVAAIISMTFGTLSLKADDGHKILVCHVTGNGSSHVIDIDTHAWPAHQAHGDSKVTTSYGKGDHCATTPSAPPPVDPPTPPPVNQPPVNQPPVVLK
jgi:hypothetical protein